MLSMTMLDTTHDLARPAVSDTLTVDPLADIAGIATRSLIRIRLRSGKTYVGRLNSFSDSHVRIRPSDAPGGWFDLPRKSVVALEVLGPPTVFAANARPAGFYFGRHND